MASTIQIKISMEHVQVFGISDEKDMYQYGKSNLQIALEIDWLISFYVYCAQTCFQRAHTQNSSINNYTIQTNYC